MRFTTLPVLPLLALLASSVAPAAAKDAWQVEIFTDDLCEDSTGFWIDDEAAACTDLSAYPDIKSIRATGDSLEARCGFNVEVCPTTDCTNCYDAYNTCMRSDSGQFDKPWKSFKVIANPC